MPGKSRKPIAGFLRPTEIAQRAIARGIPFSLSGFKRRIQKEKIKPDQYEEGVYNPSPLFREQRLEEILQGAPKKKSEIQKGEATTYTMLREAQKIDPTVHLRQVQQFVKKSKQDPKFAGDWEKKRVEQFGEAWREVFPDTIQNEFLGLARLGQLAGLFAREPRKKPRVRRIGQWRPEPSVGEMTTVDLFRKARKIDHRIQPVHIRTFLARCRQMASTNSRIARFMQGIRTISHLKYRLTVIPQGLADDFLNLVRQKGLQQFFAQPARQRQVTPKERKAVKAAPPAKQPFVARPPQAPAIPTWFKEFEARKATQFKFVIVIARLRRMLPMHWKQISEGTLAQYLGLGPKQMETLVKKELLHRTSQGMITVQSIKRLLKGYL